MVEALRYLLHPLQVHRPHHHHQHQLQKQVPNVAGSHVRNLLIVGRVGPNSSAALTIICAWIGPLEVLGARTATLVKAAPLHLLLHHLLPHQRHQALLVRKLVVLKADPYHIVVFGTG